jgi:hypothetical protein
MVGTCKEFGIIPDFLSYLYRLGPFTQDNLAYNSFRNKRIDFSLSSAYVDSWQSKSHALRVCYLLKFPGIIKSTYEVGALIFSVFRIVHMAVYYYIRRKSSAYVIMEDSIYAFNARRIL